MLAAEAIDLSRWEIPPGTSSDPVRQLQILGREQGTRCSESDYCWFRWPDSTGSDSLVMSGQVPLFYAGEQVGKGSEVLFV